MSAYVTSWPWCGLRRLEKRRLCRLLWGSGDRLRHRRECDASARPNSLAPRIGEEDEFALDDVNEFILSCVDVPG